MSPNTYSANRIFHQFWTSFVSPTFVILANKYRYKAAVDWRTRWQSPWTCSWTCKTEIYLMGRGAPSCNSCIDEVCRWLRVGIGTLTIYNSISDICRVTAIVTRFNGGFSHRTVTSMNKTHVIRCQSGKLWGTRDFFQEKFNSERNGIGHSKSKFEVRLEIHLLFIRWKSFLTCEFFEMWEQPELRRFNNSCFDSLIFAIV